MEVALMRYLDPARNTIVPNVHWAFFNHEADLLVISNTGYATEIEIKVSKSDLLADKKKLHEHRDIRLKHLYFAVPKELEDFALEHIPERAGLYVVVRKPKRYDFYGNVIEHEYSYRVKKVKKSETTRFAEKWSDEDISSLRRLGCLRILGLKEKLVKIESKNK